LETIAMAFGVCVARSMSRIGALKEALTARMQQAYPLSTGVCHYHSVHNCIFSRKLKSRAASSCPRALPPYEVRQARPALNLKSARTYGGPKVCGFPFQFIPESGRRDSIIATNRYWPKLLAYQKSILR
jgi:hypothetical protein